MITNSSSDYALEIPPMSGNLTSTPDNVNSSYLNGVIFQKLHVPVGWDHGIEVSQP